MRPERFLTTHPGGGRTDAFVDSDAAKEALYRIDPGQITADLNAVADYVTGLSAANGKAAVAGFCWGGSQTFRFTTDRKDLAAAFVFYGTGPDDGDAIGRITALVYGFYGGDDARVGKTIPLSERLMKGADKTYEYVVYDGAGHAFMRRGEESEPKADNTRAMEKAWERWLDLLKKDGSSQKRVPGCGVDHTQPFVIADRIPPFVIASRYCAKRSHSGRRAP